MSDVHRHAHFIPYEPF